MTLPVQTASLLLMGALRPAGLPASVSNTAGTFVCNTPALRQRTPPSLDIAPGLPGLPLRSCHPHYPQQPTDRLPPALRVE